MKITSTKSQTIIIHSIEIWNETGIEILSVEEYWFIAEGFWKDLLGNRDANGCTSSYMDLFNRRKRSPENNWFALIGSIEKTNHFLIGANNQIVFDKSGKLFCYANDMKGFLLE